jgi:hypothetical protein
VAIHLGDDPVQSLLSARTGNKRFVVDAEDGCV